MKDFAWSQGSKGQYLHPALEVNLSGFAATAGGEVRLHPPSDALPETLQAQLNAVVRNLPETQKLRTLSGGETVRVLTVCALQTGSPSIAFDCVLEQLDPVARKHFLEEIIKPLSAGTDVAVADNASADSLQIFDTVRKFEHSTLDLNANIGGFVRTLASVPVSAPTIELKQLSFQYPGTKRWVLDRADFKFEPGRPYLIKAPNGAGKSTLARILVGVLNPTRGSIVVNGASVQPSKSARRLFFYAFQNPASQLMGTSCKGYLELVSRTAARSETWLEGSWPYRPDDVLNALGLSTFAQTEPFDLPFVALKRLTVAAALLGRAPWLYFDEPALTADQGSRHALCELFNGLCRSGFGIILVSHGTEFDGLTGVVPLTMADGKIWERDHG